MAQLRSRRGLHPRRLDLPRVTRVTARLRVLPLLLALASGVLLACGDRAPSSSDADPDVPVRVGKVAIDAQDTPVVVLEEQDGPRWLPIWIGLAEAQSIALQIEEVRPPRPNTHDLAREVIHGLRGRVARVVITELRGSTYYAILDVRAGDELLRLDARPSDAIAIALRDGAPIFVRASLFVSAGAEEPGDAEPVPAEDATGLRI